MRRDCRKWGGMLVFSKNYLKIFFFFLQKGHKWCLPVGIPLRHLFHLGIYSTCPQFQKVSISISILWAGLATFQRESWHSETSVWSKRAFFFFFFNCLMPALGLHCCSWTFSSFGQGQTLFAVVQGPLAVGASLVGEHGLSSWGPRAWLLPGMWNLPQWGIAPVSPALAGDFYPLYQQESPEEDFLKLSAGVSVYLVCSLGSTWDWSHRGTFPERSTSQAWFSGWISETRFAF